MRYSVVLKNDKCYLVSYEGGLDTVLELVSWSKFIKFTIITPASESGDVLFNTDEIVSIRLFNDLIDTCNEGYDWDSWIDDFITEVSSWGCASDYFYWFKGFGLNLRKAYFDCGVVRPARNYISGIKSLITGDDLLVDMLIAFDCDILKVFNELDKQRVLGILGIVIIQARFALSKESYVAFTSAVATFLTQLILPDKEFKIWVESEYVDGLCFLDGTYSGDVVNWFEERCRNMLKLKRKL